ncbi:LOW QUALITY PROTEIN: hypothetical protein CVT25_007900 [Psilocybe cyanescens]|uniref:ubiquitinyl hydrolase 1 n=1 Tax=Psilocybe cyanescens TaxID=93625 RepID=A0A409W2B1_PSICY|nr:LOW QUALITY PROTEIN: hypothetical protein CVT25_007900 [Psilocybe cyanescens]
MTRPSLSLKGSVCFSPLALNFEQLEYLQNQEIKSVRKAMFFSNDISVRDFAENVWELGAEKCQVILDVSFQLREDTLVRFRQVLNPMQRPSESELHQPFHGHFHAYQIGRVLRRGISEDNPMVYQPGRSDRPAPSKIHGRHSPILPRPRPPRPQHWAPAPVRLRLWVPSPPRRGMRPVSSVVGFWIPAAALAAGAAMGLSGSRRSELIAPPTSDPQHPTPPPTSTTTSGAINFTVAAAPANTALALSKHIEAAMGATLKIRPCGLAGEQREHVLRALGAAGDGALPAVSPAFWGAWAGGAGWGEGWGGKETETETEEKGRETPLVDATIEFLGEFVDDKDKEVAKAVNGNGGANGNTLASTFAVASGNGNGFGKEAKGRREGERDEDDWDGESFLPTGIYDAIKAKMRFDSMRGRHQEDAEEFFAFYLDTLEEELLTLLIPPTPPAPGPSLRQVNGVEPGAGTGVEEDGWLGVGTRNRMVHTRTIRATESPITRIFGGKFRSTLRVPGQKDLVIVEDWRTLSLDIEIHSIQDAPSYVTQTQGQDMRTVEAQQQVLIEALPPILVLYIKRFCYDTAVRGVVKEGKQVVFGPELEIGSGRDWILNDTIVDVMVPAAKKAQPVRCKLFGGMFFFLVFSHLPFSPPHPYSAVPPRTVRVRRALYPGRAPSIPIPHIHTQCECKCEAEPPRKWVRINDNLVLDVQPVWEMRGEAEGMAKA